MHIADSVMTVLDKPIFSVPFQKDHHFIDRKGIFSRIEEQLLVHYRVSLCGIGGIGYCLLLEYIIRFTNRILPGNLRSLSSMLTDSKSPIHIAMYFGCMPPIMLDLSRAIRILQIC